ncbi:FAD-dependent monooxygenase [Nocardia testacea]|uniref:FAD-dependent monooxygenase n=1 Tax=Nocardia testacea TaxID=248551 RepID=UPI003C2B8BC2
MPDRFLARGIQRPVGGIFAAITEPAPAGRDSAHTYLLGIPQPVIEQLLEDHAIELGAQIRRGCAVTGFEQDGAGVTVDLAGGERPDGYVSSIGERRQNLNHHLSRWFGEPTNRYRPHNSRRGSGAIAARPLAYRVVDGPSDPEVAGRSWTSSRLHR